MRYFIPDIRVAGEVPGKSGGVLGWLRGPQAAVDHPPERLGGLPWGLPPHRWPRCRECGKSQSLLAQLLHDGERLDLGRAGRMLFVFQCAHDPGMCSTWEAFSGANACFVIEPEDLQNAGTPIPEDKPPLEHAITIAGWVEKNDLIPPDLAPAFLSESSFLSIAEDSVSKISASTRLGGVPFWIQSPDEAPRPGWRFAGQLDSGYSFLTPPQKAYPWISQDRERYEDRTHFARGPNFGDGGIAYLFLQDGDGIPEGCMFWQCG